MVANATHKGICTDEKGEQVKSWRMQPTKAFADEKGGQVKSWRTQLTMVLSWCTMRDKYSSSAGVEQSSWLKSLNAFSQMRKGDKQNHGECDSQSPLHRWERGTTKSWWTRLTKEFAQMREGDKQNHGKCDCYGTTCERLLYGYD